jgi:hypothetical protein
VVAAVFFGESVVLVLFVLLYPEFEIAGDAYVQDPCPAGHDIGVVGWGWHLCLSLVRLLVAGLDGFGNGWRSFKSQKQAEPLLGFARTLFARVLRLRCASLRMTSVGEIRRLWPSMNR